MMADKENFLQEAISMALRNPIINSKFRSLCKKLIEFSEHWLVKFILYAVVWVPASMLTLAIKNTKIWEEISKKFDITHFIDRYSIITFLIVYLCIITLKFLHVAIKHYAEPKKELSREEIIVLFKAINAIVSHKASRLLAYTRNPTRDKFVDILQPIQQIKLLVAAIKTVFDSFDLTNTSFRVGLISVNNGEPTGWLYFVPIEQHPGKTILQSRDSMAMHAIRRKMPILIEDISEELRREQGKRCYIQGESKPKGSQFCCPVINPATEEVEYIITIKGDERKCLREQYIELYTWILDHFILRITLEHSFMAASKKSDKKVKSTTQLGIEKSRPRIGQAG